MDFDFYPVLVVFMYFMTIGFGCGPAELQKYFGKKLVPVDLKTGATGEYIAEPGDLSCDFSAAEVCRWKNTTIDDWDWKLGTGEATVAGWFDVFGTRRLANLPAAISPSANRRGHEESAWLVSDPILCQKSVGRLSFNYWGRHSWLTACAIEVNTLKVIQCGPKLNNIGKSQGQYTFTISPIDKEFQLGIRSFGHTVHPGGINVVDDLDYRAHICNPDDFGGTYEEQPLKSGLTGEFIALAKEANCEFDDSCRWGNKPGQDTNWAQGLGSANPESWERNTGSPSLPDQPFAIVNGPGGSDPSRESWLLTDPFQCQEGTGKFRFKYWLGRGAKLQVCALKKSSLQKIFCSKEFEFTGPGPVQVNIPGPIKEPFVIGVRAFNFVHPRGSFVAVDDFDYSAEICFSGDLGGTLTTSTLPNGLTGDNVEKVEDLTCQFGPDEACRWGNGNGNGSWELATGSPDPKLWEKATGTDELPDGPFTLSKHGRNVAKLNTDPMLCQNGDGILSFKYWLSPGSSLEVCSLSAASGREFHCYNGIQRSASPGPARVTIPGPIDMPFIIQIRAQGKSDSDFSAIDDLSYDADICDEDNPMNSLGGQFKASSLPSGLTGEYLEVDKEANCNQFNGDCRWGSTERSGEQAWLHGNGKPNLDRWELATGTTETPDGPFAIVPTTGPKGTHSVLKTDQYRCQFGDGLLKFRYWVSGTAFLEVCVLEFVNGVKEIPKCQQILQNSPGPVVVRIPGPIENAFRLSFVVVHTPNNHNGFLAVDDVEYSADVCTGDLGSGLKFGEFPNGLQGSNVKNASELTCSVEAESSCRWGNSNEGTKSWQKVTGAPDPDRWESATGPKNIPGSSFLIANVGEGETAVFRSDPMTCQNGDGVLTFRHWIGGHAELTICAVLVANKTPVYCTVIKVTSESKELTKVDIPGPINEPFYFTYEAKGNRKYDFVAIDEINYAADLCKGGSPAENLGGTFTMTDLTGGLTGDFIEVSEEAACKFDRTCRWGQTNNPGSNQWKTGSGSPDPDRWEKATGTSAIPDGSFAILPIDGKKSSNSYLKTDLMRCQYGDGELKFKYWKTKKTDMKVCVLNSNNEEIFCETTFPRSPGPVRVKIPGSIMEPFRIGITASTTGSGFLAVDDLTYDAELCTVNVGGSLRNKPLPSGLTGELIDVASDLDCDLQATCRWGNSGNPEYSQFELAEGKPDPNKWKKATGTGTVPVSPFTSAKLAGGKKAVLRSDPIRCQTGDGKLSFKYWMTPEVTLEVCAVASNNDQNIFCSSSMIRKNAPGPAAVTIEGDIPEEFYLAFKAVGPQQDGFIAIDEISYEANVCPASTTPLPTTLAPPNVVEACEKLKCNFEEGSCIGYNLDDSDWYRSKERIGPARNQLVGTNDGDWFLASPVLNHKGRSVVESVDFKPFEAPVNYTFFYSRGTYGSHILFCVNDQESENCQKVSSGALTLAETQKFVPKQVTLPVGTSKIIFVFYHDDATSGRAQAGLDVFNFEDVKSGQKIC